MAVRISSDENIRGDGGGGRQANTAISLERSREHGAAFNCADRRNIGESTFTRRGDDKVDDGPTARRCVRAKSFVRFSRRRHPSDARILPVRDELDGRIGGKKRNVPVGCENKYDNR